MNWIEREFLYYTETQLATLERLTSIRSAKSEVRRQEGIVDGMVSSCRRIIVGSSASGMDEVRRLKLPRLAALLNAADHAGDVDAR